MNDLKKLGADAVISEEDLRSRETVSQLLSQVGELPRLGLNCVGGKSATDLARLLR